RGAAAGPGASVAGTMQAALKLAAGQSAAGEVSAKVVLLTEGVMKAMLLAKLKIATGVALLLAVLGAGIGATICVCQTEAGDAQRVPKPAARPADKEITELPGSARQANRQRAAEAEGATQVPPRSA